MNYQHLYHAGCAADVFKHLVLLTLLDLMKQKEKPFCYIDTHAGCGVYDLTQNRIQEWRQGVGLLKQHQLIHPLLQYYREAILDVTRFPGSPLIARYAIRPQDEIILIELAEEAFYTLKRLFQSDKQVHIHHLDAYKVPKVLLPPSIRRGLILVDPPYEDPHEFDRLPTFLSEALNRFATATYMLWYPIKSRKLVTRFHDCLKKKITQENLVIEMCLWPDDVALRMNGSGLIIINPPWKLTETIHPLMNELIQILKQHEKAFWRTFTL